MNTKKIALLSLFIAFLSLGSFVSVYAENGANVNANISGEIKLDRIKMEEKREEMMETRKENIEQFKERHRSLMKKRIAWGLEMMTRRFNAAVERLEKITLRIESRIEKLKDDGENTGEAEGFVASAKVKMAEAKEDILKLPITINAAIDASVNASNSTSTPPVPPKGAFEEVRKLVSEIREELKATHGLLVRAITSIKGLRVGVESSTTITP